MALLFFSLVVDYFFSTYRFISRFGFPYLLFCFLSFALASSSFSAPPLPLLSVSSYPSSYFISCSLCLLLLFFFLLLHLPPPPSPPPPLPPPPPPHPPLSPPLPPSHLLPLPSPPPPLPSSTVPTNLLETSASYGSCTSYCGRLISSSYPHPPRKKNKKIK